MVSASRIADLREKYPDRCLVIVRPRTPETPCIRRRNLIVPRDATIGEFARVLKKMIHPPDPERSLLILTDLGRVPPAAQRVGDVHAQDASSDGVLRLVYAYESVFGGEF